MIVAGIRQGSSSRDGAVLGPLPALHPCRMGWLQPEQAQDVICFGRNDWRRLVCTAQQNKG